MSAAAQVDDLINDVYDAALDPSRWPQVLQRTAALLGGMSAAIYSRDAGALNANFNCSVGMDPDFSELFSTHYVKTSPLVPYEEALPSGAVFAGSEAMPYAELRASSFFNEWARPQGFADFVGAVLDKSPGRMAKLFVNRHERQGPADREALSIMRLLAPHFRRAIQIGKLVERTEHKLSALSDVLDRLPAAAVLVDRHGRLVHGTEPALQMLSEGNALHWVNGKPRPADARAEAHLQAILASALNGQGVESVWGVASTHTLMNGDRVDIRILPLSKGTQRRDAAPRAAVAAIIVSRCALDVSQRLQSAARLYEFTPAESRVVRALMSGGTLGSVAKALGVAEATVKTHLQHIFDKTGARRQVDLVQLIADPGGPP